MGNTVEELEIEHVLVDPITGEPIAEPEFKIGDVLVRDDLTVLGVFAGECVSEDQSEKWPSFFCAFDCGKYIENYNDYCADDETTDWKELYHLATDDEEEEFLIALEATTGLTWDFKQNILVPVDESSWKIKGQYYPSTWSAGIDADVDEMTDFEDDCYFSKGASPLRALGQLIVLRDIYMKGQTVDPDDVVYAIVVDPDNKIVIRPYRYGVRNSILTFKYDEQVRTFLTNFEDLVIEAAALLK